MITELKGVLRTGLDFETFINKYFGAFKQSDYTYKNDENETLNLNIANEFYDDFVNSGVSIDQYIEDTTSEGI